MSIFKNAVIDTVPVPCKTCGGTVHSFFCTREDYEKGVECMDCRKKGLEVPKEIVYTEPLTTNPNEGEQNDEP
jgi:hypothetical protein